MLLIRQELLPDETMVSAPDPGQSHMFDLSGELLPIVGSIDLSVCIGTYRNTVTFGVVPQMPVPVLLGSDFTTLHVPVICGPEGYIRMFNGESVPILHQGNTVDSRLPDPRASAPESHGARAALCLAKRVVLPPRSRGYALVTTTFKGIGFVSPTDRVYNKHQVQFESGPMT